MIRYFALHPTAANLLAIGIVLLGLSSLGGLERETFPQVENRRLVISVVDPGASASDVDEEICRRIDRALGGISGLGDLECLAAEFGARAVAHMLEGGDLAQFYNDVSSALSAIKDFPASSEPFTLEIAGTMDQIALLAISGIDDSRGLVRYADQLADRISSLPLIASAEVSGISGNELQIRFDTESLRQYGLSARTVIDTVKARNVQRSLGTLETTDADIPIRFFDSRRNVSELEDLVILQNESGSLVRLRDIARVFETEAAREQQAYLDGNRAAIVSVVKVREDDALNAFAGLRSFIDEENGAYPAPFHISVIRDQTVLVSDRISLVVRNTLQGLVLVLLVMWGVFVFREAVWIAFTLPVSFLGAFFVMDILGISINVITLVALLMAVGLIMDDSIVISDNIRRWRARLSGEEASAKGAREVLPGVLSSFFTTACVFGPLAFISGTIGIILKYVPIVLLITLTVSLLEAFFILPRHLSHVAKNSTSSSISTRGRFLDQARDLLVIPAVSWLVERRYLTLGLTVMILLFSVALVGSGKVRFEGFPNVEGDTIEARVALTSGLPLDRARQVVEQLVSAAEEIDSAFPDEDAGLVRSILVQHSVNMDVKDLGAHTFTVVLDLRSNEVRNTSADTIIRRWRELTGPLSDLVQINFTQSALGPGGRDVDIELTGENLEELQRAASALVGKVSDLPGTGDIFTDFSGQKREVRFSMRESAYALGVSPEIVADQLRKALFGIEIDTFRMGASETAVRIQWEKNTLGLIDLRAFPVRLPGGQQIALEALVEMTEGNAFPQISRLNGVPIARILGNIDRQLTSAAAISKQIHEKIWVELAEAFPGVSLKIGGATEEETKTRASMLRGFLIGLVGVFLILSFQFRSFTIPIVVMLAIPFAFVGTIWGHFALGVTLSMPSMIGFASLAGIVVNNSILFMTFFLKGAEHSDASEAAKHAAYHRFRPIFLSSVTTIVGMLPILFETSPQAQVLIPLIVSVAFGLAASTILIVFVFPCAISIYFDFARLDRWRMRFSDNSAG